MGSSYFAKCSSDPYALVRKYSAGERAVVDDPRQSADLIGPVQNVNDLNDVLMMIF